MPPIGAWMDAGALTHDPIGRSNRVRFGSAHMARSLGWSTIDMILAWHLHTVVGLSGESVSVLLFVFLVIGSATNLFVGCLLTWLDADGRDYVRLQLLGSIAAATLLVAQFLVMDTWWVVVVGIAFRVAYAVQDVPQNALGSLLPSDAGDAKIYARLHVILSSAARLVAIGGHLLLLQADGSISRAVALVGIAALVIASAGGLCGVRFPVRAEAIARRPMVRAGIPVGAPQLLFGFSLAAMLLPTVNRLLIFSPGAQDQPHLGAWMLAAFYTGSMAGPLVQARATSILGERDAVLASVGAAVVSGAMVIVPTIPILRELGAVVHGLALSVIGVRLWATAAAIAMRDAESGRNRDGLIFGAVIVTTQLSMAFGALLLGPLIDTYEAGDRGAGIVALFLTGVGGLLIAGLEVRQKRAPALA